MDWKGIIVYDSETGEEVKNYPADNGLIDTNPALYVEYSKGGNYLTYNCWMNYSKLINLKTDSIEIETENYCYFSTISPDETKYATNRVEGVEIFDINSKQKLWGIDHDYYDILLFLPKSNYLCIGKSFHNFLIYQVKSNKLIAQTNFGLKDAVFTNDGNYLLITNGAKVTLYNISNVTSVNDGESSDLRTNIIQNIFQIPQRIISPSILPF